MPTSPLLVAMHTAPPAKAQPIKRSMPDHKNIKRVSRAMPVEKQVTVKTTTKPNTTTRVPDKKFIATVRHKSAFAKPESLTVTENNATVSATTTYKPQARHNTKPAQNEQQAINQRIQKQLQTKIRFNQYYPGIAVRNAWEGRVSLGMRVLANGELTNIHVINSSGYHILDKAAVKSVVRVATLPEASAWLQGRDIDVILLVIYKLTDS